MKDKPDNKPTMGGDIHAMRVNMKSLLDYVTQHPPVDNTQKILDAIAGMHTVLVAMAADIHALLEQGTVPPDPPITSIDVTHGPVTTDG